MNRREFLSLVALGAVSMSGVTLADQSNFWNRPRWLWLVNYKGEEFKEVYWQDGKLIQSAYAKICHLMRDLHENEAVSMDVRLLDVLRGVQGYFENVNYIRPIHINSGYRTLKTNNKLIKANGEGAAKNSFHLKGKAVDFRMENVNPEWIARLGVYYRQGGVGLYVKDNFVHLDTGGGKAIWKR